MPWSDVVFRQIHGWPGHAEDARLAKGRIVSASHSSVRPGAGSRRGRTVFRGTDSQEGGEMGFSIGCEIDRRDVRATRRACGGFAAAGDMLPHA